MIVIVQKKGYKKILINSLLYIAIMVMFYFYYNHMCDKFANQNKTLKKDLNITKVKYKSSISTKYEKIIYKEAISIVDLLGKENIISMKIVNKRLLIICNENTNIMPLMVRYGVNAYIKNTKNRIKIAIDLSTIVEKKI